MRDIHRSLKSFDMFLGIPRCSQANVGLCAYPRKTKGDPKLSPLPDLQGLYRQEVKIKAVVHTHTHTQGPTGDLLVEAFKEICPTIS